LAGLTVGESSEKKFAVIIMFRKFKKKLTSARASSENVAFLTERTQYTGGARY
jgi:hypothetical protein